MSCFPIQGVRKYKKVLGEAFKVSSSITQSWKHPKKKSFPVYFKVVPQTSPPPKALSVPGAFWQVAGAVWEVTCVRSLGGLWGAGSGTCHHSVETVVGALALLSSCLSGLSLQVLMCLLLCLWFDRMTSLMTWTAFLLQQRPWRKEAHIRSLWWQLTACYPLMPPGWLKSLPLMR